MLETPPPDPADHAEDFSGRYAEALDIAAGQVMLELGSADNEMGSRPVHELSTISRNWQKTHFHDTFLQHAWDHVTKLATNPFHRAIYVTGPTASGKTAVGVELARRIDAEVIALDAFTLYRGMDIGTAKPTLAERLEVPHHLIDVIDPWESASAADYRTWALEKVLEIESRGRRVLFVGGTPLYLKSLLRGMFEGPSADPALREELEAEVVRVGEESIHARLQSLDRLAASRIHPNNSRRVIRALEVITLTGRPLSDQQTEHDTPGPADLAVFALQRPRPLVCERINRRVLAMFEAGLVEEVRALISGPKPLHLVPSQGVGYREVIAYLNGEFSFKEAIVRVQARTRQFSKRQGTWFRGLQEIKPWPVADDEPPEKTAERLACAISASG